MRFWLAIYLPVHETQAYASSTSEHFSSSLDEEFGDTCSRHWKIVESRVLNGNELYKCQNMCKTERKNGAIGLGLRYSTSCEWITPS